jgi:hypothetical protein
MPAPVAIKVTASQQRELMRIVKPRQAGSRRFSELRIILRLAQGLSHEEIAALNWRE